MIAKPGACALAALAICAAAQAKDAPPAPANPWDRIHTVAIISGIGTQLRLQNDSFGTDTKPLDIGDWNIDAQLTATLKRYLAGRFKFADVKYDAAALAQIPSGAWDNYDHPTRAFDNTLAAGGVDAFIIVRPSEGRSIPGPAGLVLENRNAADRRPVEWADYEIDIVDARTFAPIATAQSCIQPRVTAAPGFAAVMGDASVNPGGNLAVSDAQRTALEADFTTLVSQSLTETVRALALNVPLPDIGARTLVPTDQLRFPDIKRVAVISTVGDQLDMEQISTIQRGEKQMPIADWHLDDQIEAAAKDAMAKRFAFGNGSADRAALAGAEIIGERGKVASTFPGLQPSSDVDAYIVFVKMPNASAGTAPGVGILKNDPLFGGDARADIFANYAVAVIDAHTLKLLAIDKATTSPKFASPNPSATIDAAVWPSYSTPLTDDQSAKIHQGLTDILADSIPETLLRMGLTGMTIAGPPVQTGAK